MDPKPQTSTTYVQADATTFREIVQRLTGSNDHPEKPRAATPAVGGPRRPPFKLHDRRPSVRKLEIKLGLTSLRSPMRSPVTPLSSDLQFSPAASEEEERAIAEKGFYLHPSPLSTPRVSDPPELLPLFPLRSPKHASEDSP
ncbi:hypothetical protein QJS10_CPB18g00327 [Acorus calamus]|uniref:VQ domain-containing protein n=1 Tax=Acorus calamus TaxID=4465 RepID=A0AAV9CJG9_ACOCL|nr:hypothetical protein QJS10_CPB18g00327 [Acorus calamus]